MLTGLFGASAGTIFVYGKDIKTDLHTVRKNMGVCMQHDVLFSYLTTKEHLLLYGSIKVPQWTKKQLHEEVKRSVMTGMRTCIGNSSQREVQAMVIIPVENIFSQTNQFFSFSTSLELNTFNVIVLAAQLYRNYITLFNSGFQIASNPLFLILLVILLVQAFQWDSRFYSPLYNLSFKE